MCCGRGVRAAARQYVSPSPGNTSMKQPVIVPVGEQPSTVPDYPMPKKMGAFYGNPYPKKFLKVEKTVEPDIKEPAGFEEGLTDQEASAKAVEAANADAAKLEAEYAAEEALLKAQETLNENGPAPDKEEVIDLLPKLDDEE